MAEHVHVDVMGLRPPVILAPELRDLSLRQRQALRAAPLLPAVSELIWKLADGWKDLSPDGARLTARVLFACAEALDQFRRTITTADVDIQILAGQITVAAREMARDLRRGALGYDGDIGLVLSASSRIQLAQIEAWHPELSHESAPAGYADLPEKMTVMLDTMQFSRAVV